MNKLQKTLGLLVLTVSAPITLSAQGFAAGDNVIGLGAGVGGVFGFGPVVMLNYDHGMGFNAGPGVVGIGAYVSYKSYARTWNYYPYSYSYRNTAFTIAARGTYHWNSWHKVDKLDVYGGVMLGLSFRSDSRDDFNYSGYPYDSYKGVRPVGGLLVGAHWYFTDSFGVFAELGSTDANISAGLAFKF